MMLIPRIQPAKWDIRHKHENNLLKTCGKYKMDVQIIDINIIFPHFFTVEAFQNRIVDMILQDGRILTLTYLLN
jgi:hypothetical protein